jgi:hypothetical protein
MVTGIGTPPDVLPLSGERRHHSPGQCRSTAPLVACSDFVRPRASELAKLAGLYTIEEINDASFQRILGTDDEKSLILDDPLENL